MDTDLLPTYLRDSKHQGPQQDGLTNYSSDEDNYSPSIKNKLRTIRKSHLLQQLHDLETMKSQSNSPPYTHSPNHERPSKIASMPSLSSDSSQPQSPRFFNTTSKKQSRISSPEVRADVQQPLSNSRSSRDNTPNPRRSPMRRTCSLSPRSGSPSPGRMSYTTSVRSQSRYDSTLCYDCFTLTVHYRVGALLET